MKRLNIIRLSAVIFTLCAMFACNKESWVMYDASQQSHVFFDKTKVSGELDTLDIKQFSFAFEPQDEVQYSMKVSMMGLPVSYARDLIIEFTNDTMTKYMVGSDAVAVIPAVKGVDFELVKAEIPANSVTGSVTLKLIRPADKGKFRSVFMRIQPSKDFKVMSRDYNRVLTTDGEPSCPAWWITTYKEVTKNWYMYLGTFTPLKYRMLLDKFWEMEQTRPTIYSEFEYKYGKYLDQTEYINQETGEIVQVPDGFMSRDNPATWAKYALKPLFEYFKKNYPDAEGSVGYTTGSASVTTGGWKDPAALYR